MDMNMVPASAPASRRSAVARPSGMLAVSGSRLRPAGARAGARARPPGRRPALALAAHAASGRPHGARDRLARSSGSTRPARVFASAPPARDLGASRSRSLAAVAVIGFALHACLRAAAARLGARGDRRRNLPRAEEPASTTSRPSRRGLDIGHRWRAARRLRRSSGATSRSSTRRASRAPRSSRRRKIFPTGSWRRPSGISLLGLPGLLGLQARQHRRFHDRQPLAAPRGLRLGGRALRRSPQFRSGAASALLIAATAALTGL